MRLYNGCPDSELAAIWKSQGDARDELRKVAKQLHNGRAWCTYFPLEGQYMCSMWIPVNDTDEKYVSLTEDFFPTVEAACAAAIQTLKITGTPHVYTRNGSRDSSPLC